MISLNTIPYPKQQPIGCFICNDNWFKQIHRAWDINFGVKKRQSLHCFLDVSCIEVDQYEDSSITFTFSILKLSSRSLRFEKNIIIPVSLETVFAKNKGQVFEINYILICILGRNSLTPSIFSFKPIVDCYIRLGKSNVPLFSVQHNQFLCKYSKHYYNYWLTVLDHVMRRKQLLNIVFSQRNSSIELCKFQIREKYE